MAHVKTYPAADFDKIVNAYTDKVVCNDNAMSIIDDERGYSKFVNYSSFILFCDNYDFGDDDEKAEALAARLDDWYYENEDDLVDQLSDKVDDIRRDRAA